MARSVMTVGSSGGAIMALIAKNLIRNRYASDLSPFQSPLKTIWSLAN